MARALNMHQVKRDHHEKEATGNFDWIEKSSDILDVV